MATKAIATGVTRFDIEERNTHGCLMRICRQGKRIQEFFSDAAYGSKKKAREAAIARYHELDKQLPERGSTKDQLTARNASGQVGVYQTTLVDVSGKDKRAFCAGWTDPDGTRKKINFSFAKYGEKMAWELACFARAKRMSNRQEVIAAFEQQKNFRAPRRKK